MPDRISLMLDSMISAVDNGLSYDGIVSVPETGLEDFGHRPGVAGWVDDSVDLLRSTKAAVAGYFHGTHPPTRASREDDKLSKRDSGIGEEISQSGNEKVQVQPDPDSAGESPADHGEQILEDTSREGRGNRPEIPPRKRDNQLQVSGESPMEQDHDEVEVLPRK